MPTFTFIADYDGGTYISQCDGATVRKALRKWLRTYDFSVIPKLTVRDIKILQQNLSEDIPTPIKSVRNVWFAGSTFPKGCLWLNIIKTTKS